MRRVVGMALGVLLVAASTATWAFDEQQMKGDAPPAATGLAPTSPKVDGKALEFKGPDAKQAEQGTKIRIPGLGVIGEIPKIDLGLDLLYGATDTKRSDLDRDGNGAMLRARIPLQSR